MTVVLAKKQILLGAIAMLLACCAYVYPTWQSPSKTLAFIGGKEIFCEQTVVDVGRVKAAQEVKLSSVEFMNLSWRENSLLGRNLSCQCIETEELPKYLQPGEKTEFEMRFPAPENIGSFNFSVTVFTSDAESQAVVIQIVGDVVD